MPVIVIGADTPHGASIVAALQPASGEIRLFLSDADSGEEHRNVTKVAVGDVSDGSHIGGAAIGAFCAVAIVAAATDERERHFAADPAAVLAQWADALRDAAVGRVIAVGTAASMPEPNPLADVAGQYAWVEVSGRDPVEIAAEVAGLEAAADL